MSEVKDRLNRIVSMCEGNSGVCKDIAFEARMALQAVDSAPLTVIVPPIEWGEWNGNAMVSKCGRYQLSAPFAGSDETLLRPWFLHEDAAQWIGNDRLPKHKAIAACQSHAQAAVDKALQGCNVIPYRDPQGLVDAVKKEIAQMRKADGSMRAACYNLETAAKKWEERK